MGRMMQRLLQWQHLRKKSDHATRTLVLFFFVTVLLGTILLSLPVSSKSGESCGLLTALFTATSATCVTGLSPVDTFSQWSTMGQVVLLGLIQVGGLGYMMVVSVAYFLLRRRIGLRERLILQQAMALNELDGIIRLVRMVLAGTGLVEGLGAVILSIRFLSWMPVGQAVWYGVFHAISAFCNAGFDLMGAFAPGSSLTLLAGDVVVNVTIMALILIGGLGFFVWNDLLMHRFRWKRLAVHTKLVLLITGGLTLAGTGLLLAVEWSNPQTLGALAPGKRVLAAAFQAVTTRTAGFCSVNQGGLTGSGKLLSILLMLVGGSSGSNAGGIKTVTVGLLLLMAIRVLRGRRDIVVFGRRIPQDQVNSAGSICFLVIALAVSGGIILAATNGISLGDAMYETVSAICTVGLSTGITAGLNLGSKILLIVYMFFGRVGIMTVSFAFMTCTPPDNAIGRPEVRVLVG